MKLAIVTASLDPEKTQEYWGSWAERAEEHVTLFMAHPTAKFSIPYDSVVAETAVVIVPTRRIVGVIPAFMAGIRAARIGGYAVGYDIIACLHDDLRIDEPAWDRRVVRFFETHPRCGMVGFSGASGLGDPDIYEKPYAPHQLARRDFFSNMSDAEKHGRRELQPRRAACFDGFSQIGRASLLLKLFERLTALGVVHHMYDSALGAMSIRDGWENWYLPISCHHAGGMTAVGSGAYNEWAKTQRTDGDQGFWEESHRILYEELRDVLPVVVEE